ncbi:MAG TPA: DUF72 domain-containing protein [Desulfomonilia bacterium]|nr:DUF72 domain-containing protein [Desulfomonilia bacterium]
MDEKPVSHKPRWFIGTSGWNYDHWRGAFYPDGLPKTRWLKYYAGIFQTVEVNATFYGRMQPSTYEKWKQTTPEGFLWSVKASRFITHIRRLDRAEDPTRTFLESVSRLGEKLGPILFQLPPSLAFEKSLAESFFPLLPHGGRYVIEARHKSWVSDEALTCLKDHGIAWCISDTAGRYPYREAVTAGFIYIRLHGSKRLYASCYTEDELKEWAAKMRNWGLDAYVYFDNDFMGYAPMNAVKLRELLA